MSDFGEMNGHAIGIIMKELARRAIEAIRRERLSFSAQVKQGYDGEMNDVMTSADAAAQKIYIKSLQECFPKFGIVAEEDELRIECTHPNCDIYFTVDPLDGTKAFVRRQSHGIGTMIALVKDGAVIAAAIGDINTKEIFYFRPGSDRVHRIYDMDVAERLQVDKSKTLMEQRWVLRDPSYEYSRQVDTAMKTGGIRAGHEIDGGSIGTMFARLWKGEVGAVILCAGWQTPWDLTPIFGISQKLGFRFLDMVPVRDTAIALEAQLDISPKKFQTDHEIVVVHESRIDDLREIFDVRYVK